ncbi:hypothetical protein C2G38_2220450 [Gigaspora rosea]|uniref:Uncharacterized protein n=1 Tax=Gigaspora rosea TaxID=44941 RepID=A0A397U8T8_9GLOM|nr:hypothetical protein C2G38_2220450 [Gigaspora rosea]
MNSKKTTEEALVPLVPKRESSHSQMLKVKLLDEKPPNDEQLPKVLKFVLEVVENIIKNDHKEDSKEIKYIPSFIKVFPQEARPVKSRQKGINSEKVLGPYYAAEKSCDVMQDRGCKLNSELKYLIDGYLKELDNLIPKLREDETQKVFDTYYVPDEPEKKLPQDVAFGLEIDLKLLQMLLSECNDILQRWAIEKKKYSRKPLDEKSEEEVVFKKDENKAPNICLKFIEAGNVDETDKSERIGVEKDKEKDELNEAEILVEPNYVRCGTFGNCRQKE